MLVGGDIAVDRWRVMASSIPLRMAVKSSCLGDMRDYISWPDQAIGERVHLKLPFKALGRRTRVPIAHVLLAPYAFFEHG